MALLPQSIWFLVHLTLIPTLSHQTRMELHAAEWADLIGKKIWSFTEDIAGSDCLRKGYEGSLKEVERINEESLMRKSAENMELYFGKKIESLKRIQAKAEKTYKEQANQTVSEENVKYVNMLDLNASSIPVTLTYDERFKRFVNLSRSGIQIPGNVYDKDPGVLRTIQWSAALDDVFKKNFQKHDPTLKWQYFGSYDAVFRTYPGPGKIIGDPGKLCQSLDKYTETKDDNEPYFVLLAKTWTNKFYSARRRPWYTQGAASPKNMVVLLDRSGSMVGQTSFIARLAVSNLIDTLSENDFLNVLYFNDKVTSLSCNCTLIQARERNRQWFKSKLISTGFINPANWKLALTEAFELLKKSSGANCQKVLMIFTDGTEEKYEDIFEKYNKNKEVRVFTYLVGTPSVDTNHLTWMACSNKGYYYRIRTVGAVRDHIENYVSVLSRPMADVQGQSPVWTNVYKDASGLGMMVTGTLPVFSDGKFLGVCGMDVTIKELEHVIYKPHLGEDGYSFLINNNGHIVSHPNLRSMLGYVKGSGDVDLTDAEFVPNEEKDKLLGLREKMLSISNGLIQGETLNVFYFTEYDSYLRAFQTKRKYFYTRLNNTPFSLAIASSEFGYEVKQFQPFIIDNDFNPSNGTVFLENWNHCSNVSVLEKTTDRDLRQFFQNNQCNGDASSSNLLLDLNITQPLERVWNSNNFSKNILFAFVKTHWGLLRITEPSRVKDVTGTLMERIHKFTTDHIIVSAPYNKGYWNSVTDPELLVYRGVKMNVSNLPIIPAVSGFQINEGDFIKDYLKNASLKDSYHVYLVDENAFIVSSSLSNTTLVTGKFLGSVDWELMAELEKGDRPLYKRFSFVNKQGECPQSPSKTSSSSIRYTLYSTIATVFTSWTKKILACVLQVNLYNWFFADAATTNTSSVSSEQKVNRSCVTNMTTYFADITTWTNFSGNTTCLRCEDFETMRRFFVSPVPRTNLVLIMVEYFETRFLYTEKTEGIPGKHKEIQINANECLSSSNAYRRLPARCFVAKDQENNDCGKARILEPNICLLLVILFCTIKLSLNIG